MFFAPKQNTNVKVLTPGQHAEHAGGPYCHIPCYAGESFSFGTMFDDHCFYHISPFWTKVIWPWFNDRVTQVQVL